MSFFYVQRNQELKYHRAVYLQVANFELQIKVERILQKEKPGGRLNCHLTCFTDHELHYF